jgi:hypothetical protein
MNQAASKDAKANKQQQDGCSNVKVNLVVVEDLPHFADYLIFLGFRSGHFCASIGNSADLDYRC